jgi:RimJ/RimL family protein N-acetyltransferase
MPPTPTLATARLTLRPIAMADAPAVQRRFPRWEIVRHLAAQVPWPYPQDGAASFLAGQLERVARGEKNIWAITLTGAEDELVGIIELWPPDPETRDSRGFWLDPDFQGQGLMTEAADAVVDYAFGTLGWPFLWLGNAKANVRSARVKERQGATLIDEVPFQFVFGEDLRQVWLLTAEAWRAQRNG